MTNGRGLTDPSPSWYPKKRNGKPEFRFLAKSGGKRKERFWNSPIPQLDNRSKSFFWQSLTGTQVGNVSCFCKKSVELFSALLHRIAKLWCRLVKKGRTEKEIHYVSIFFLSSIERLRPVAGGGGGGAKIGAAHAPNPPLIRRKRTIGKRRKGW